jgi:hypothetical protein
MKGDRIGSALYIWTGKSTDTKPKSAYGGQRAYETDSRTVFEWFGDLNEGVWLPVVIDGRELTYDPSLNAPGVNVAFHVNPQQQPTLPSTTLAVAASAGDIAVTVVSSAGFSIGQEIEIYNTSKELSFPRVVGVSGNILSLDRPLDRGYEVGDFVDGIDSDLSSYVGSIGSPISFRVTPPKGFRWKISRYIVRMSHTTAGDDSKFGNQPSLVTGVVVRKCTGGVMDTLDVWRNNGDIAGDTFDLTYSDKAGAGLFGTRARMTFTRFGGNPVLDGDNEDFLELLVQGDLTGNTTVKVRAQGVVYG